MRLTYRNQDNKTYWENRWKSVAVDKEMQNEYIYPLKYAKMVCDKTNGKILEAGCGAGRLLCYFKNRNKNIFAFDFIYNIIQRLKKDDPSFNIFQADTQFLPFNDNSFECILAFGLLHNFYGDDLKKAMLEINRITSRNGRLCASFRANNIQNCLNDWLYNYKSGWKKLIFNNNRKFHKSNIGYQEFKDLIIQSGFNVEQIYNVENMPLLYKFKLFRHVSHKTFNETKGRSQGYKLNFIGNTLHQMLVKFFPDQFCNLYVVIARK